MTQALERDLRLYRSIAPHQIFDVERMKYARSCCHASARPTVDKSWVDWLLVVHRKVQCAKMIQRTWRRYKGRPLTKFEAAVDMMLEQHFEKQEHDSKRKQALIQGLSTIFAHGPSKTDTTHSSLPPIDPVKLEAVKRKFRAQAEDKASVFCLRFTQPATNVVLTCASRCVASQNAAVPSRSKYHVFHETQQTAASLLGQYSLSKTMLKRRQEERIRRTARSALLLEQLAHPPPLADIVNGDDDDDAVENPATSTAPALVQEREAKLAAWLREPAIALLAADLQRAVDCHVQSSSTFEGTNQWWVASIPENIDGPPLDVREVRIAIAWPMT
jgi:hypothetical protein